MADDSGMLDENSVTLSGGDIASNKIVGGYAQEGSRPKAHDNTVIIKDGVNFTNDKTQIYGGMKGRLHLLTHLMVTNYKFIPKT